MSDKGFGSKIFGLFVESEGEREKQPQKVPSREAKSPADEVADLAAASLQAVPRPPSTPTDFDTIFREAGMDTAELDRVGKAEQLLRELPGEAPHAVKRQIVEAALRTFGFEIQKIVLAATNQQRAIDAYVKVNETATAHALQETEAQVKALTDKIAELRQDSERRSASLMAVSAAARARKQELQKVLDFFQSPPGPDKP
jgi:hypothetical protein